MVDMYRHHMWTVFGSEIRRKSGLQGFQCRRHVASELKGNWQAKGADLTKNRSSPPSTAARGIAKPPLWPLKQNFSSSDLGRQKNQLQSHSNPIGQNDC